MIRQVTIDVMIDVMMFKDVSWWKGSKKTFRLTGICGKKVFIKLQLEKWAMKKTLSHPSILAYYNPYTSRYPNNQVNIFSFAAFHLSTLCHFKPTKKVQPDNEGCWNWTFQASTPKIFFHRERCWDVFRLIPMFESQLARGALVKIKKTSQNKMDSSKVKEVSGFRRLVWPFLTPFGALAFLCFKTYKHIWSIILGQTKNTKQHLQQLSKLQSSYDIPVYLMVFFGILLMSYYHVLQ